MEQKKYIGIALFCYVFWGFQPMYWVLLMDTDPMFLLMARILTATAFVLAILVAQGRLGQIRETFRDRELMKRLIPATILTMADWGIYMWAVMSGYILDASLGYFISPLAIMLIGILVFHEKFRWPVIAAMALVIIGISISAIGYRVFPFVTISLALAFSIYAAFMKNVRIDSILSTGVQLIMMSPFALLFILFFRMGDNGVASVTPYKTLLIIGAGIISITPILLYATCVRKLSLLLMSFMQYLSPTFGLFSGILLGEALTGEKMVRFTFIWAGILVFSVSTILEIRKEKRTKGNDNS
jgi:chloramphenicol-sensitive protein RarD